MSLIGEQAIFAVILAGGSGSRLWPLSRKQFPKQYLRIDGDDTLLDATVDRIKSICPQSETLIVASSQHSTGEGYQTLKEYLTLCEPIGRNTAPAIAIAANYLQQTHPQSDPIMVVLPADHAIGNHLAFKAALNHAIDAASRGYVITFGIVPKSADTGFGYIQAGEPLEQSTELRLVERFKEKPEKALAEQYLAAGNYYWNSGMFVWRVSDILNAICDYLPPVAEVLAQINQEIAGLSLDLPHYQAAVAKYFEQMPDISIDHGVLEAVAREHHRLAVLPCDLGWNDVGSWDAVYQLMEKDKNGTACRGNVVAIDCHNSLLQSNHRLVAAIGVDDVCLIETPDALLLTKRDQTQRVREVVKELNLRNAQEHLLHLTVNRPWGSYTILEEQPGFKMKRITVLPGASLSLQRHQHRSEHWVVVSGTATVTCDDKVYTVTKNQSTYIPVGGVHRLENRGKIDVQLIEVQVGEYLEEDDIERFEDAYGRQQCELE